jgi:hypothetical protein
MHSFTSWHDSNAPNVESAVSDSVPHVRTLLAVIENLTAEQASEVETFLSLSADQRSLLLRAAQPLASPGPSFGPVVSPRQLVPDTPLGHEAVHLLIKRTKHKRQSSAMATASRRALKVIHAGLEGLVVRNEDQPGSGSVNSRTTIQAEAQITAALLPERGCTDGRRRMTGAYQHARVRQAVVAALRRHGTTTAQLSAARNQVYRDQMNRSTRVNHDSHYSYRDRRNHQRRLVNGIRAQPAGTSFRFDSTRAVALASSTPLADNGVTAGAIRPIS